MAITAGMVKELRETTGAGMMDCKKALTETNGDMEAAVELLKKSGAAKDVYKRQGIKRRYSWQDFCFRYCIRRDIRLADAAITCLLYTSHCSERQTSC